MNTAKLLKRFVILCLTLWMGMCCPGQEPQKPQTEAEKYYQRSINKRGITENPRGEHFCWQAASGMNRFAESYKAGKDADWIKWGIKYCDFLLDRMDTAPDGYKGWIGPYVYDHKRWCDVHVGDAILLRGILDIALVVKQDESLKKLYADKVKNYVETAKKHFFEKWDKRGTWRDDGPYGAYVSYDKYLEPENLKEWKYGSSVSKSELTLPFNKEMAAAEVAVKLWQLTGEDFYRDKAEKIYLLVKSRFQYFDNHYAWNYWEPFGPWDIDLKKKTTRHWVGVHAYRSGYQAHEAAMIAEAYHCGLVFDKQDMQRIINTNLQVMWNKDKENPDFINSNGRGKEKSAEGVEGFRKAWGHSNETKNAGQLWTGLLDFDQTIRDLYEARLEKDTGRSGRRHSYYENVTKKEPASFKRKHAKDNVTVPKLDFTECGDISMAAVLPQNISKGQKTIIANQSFKPGELEIALYSKNGKKKITQLYKGQVRADQMFIMEWDGTDPETKQKYAGDYTIRWTLSDGYRQQSISIR